MGAEKAPKLGLGDSDCPLFLFFPPLFCLVLSVEVNLLLLYFKFATQEGL